MKSKKSLRKKAEGHEAQTTTRKKSSIFEPKSFSAERLARKTSTTATSKPKTASTTPDSLTEVNLVPAGFAGRRKVVGIRIDESLYKRFKPVAQAYFGSVCRPIEAFMAAVIAIAETGVNFGKTVEIGRLVIERNLRSRRRLVVEEEVEIVDRAPNYYNRKLGDWEHRDVGVSKLNEHGHVVDCACLVCRGKKRRGSRG